LQEQKPKPLYHNLLAPYSVAMATEDLNEIPCFSVSMDGSNHGSLKISPVMIKYFHEVCGA
jgi:hypothetical protein